MKTPCLSFETLTSFGRLFLIASALTVSASAQDWAKAKLESSPRHQEWVKVQHGNRTVQCFVVYPEVKNKAPAVLIIHEVYGLSDWAKDLTDQLAGAGYLVITPDLLTGLGPNGGGTSELQARGVSEVTKAVGGLPPEQVTADLDAAADYIKNDPACNGTLFVGGFCWGGAQSFRYATHRPDLKASFVFYGVTPKDGIENIHCPVYGFYAEEDARITVTVPDTEALMKKAGKTYEPVIYPGAGHGFMRAGEDPAGTPANKKAREDAWKRWLALLKKNS